ncbi:MAG: damage-inducible protein DinB [Pseudozobellia sp.]|nr:damage-inducible protein DinB [Pseudozobellia sp.]MBG48782.1 damage-inducible protein DinB [Pseudozobellia sp.]|tara:strand:+ start:420 stop:941 length:522 start_codon:yes stop_codon:yes gene_type:complete
MKKSLVILSLILGAFGSVHAQTVSSLIEDWERAKAYTLEYLEAMPADKYDFKPTEDIRSFSQQMLHLTDANYGFTSAAVGIESPIGQGESEKSTDTSKENVTKLVAAGYDFVIKGLNGMTDAELKESIQLFGRFKMTKAQAFAKLFEHQTHHRGQTTIYIRMAGITPPNEKLF